MIEVKYTFDEDTDPEVIEGRTRWGAFAHSSQLHELYIGDVCIEGTLKELETIEKTIHAYAKEVNDGSSTRESHASQGAHAVQG